MNMPMPKLLAFYKCSSEYVPILASAYIQARADYTYITLVHT